MDGRLTPIRSGERVSAWEGSWDMPRDANEKPIRLKCPGCAQQYQVPARAGGRTFQCRKCGSPIPSHSPAPNRAARRAARAQSSAGPRLSPAILGLLMAAGVALTGLVGWVLLNARGTSREAASPEAAMTEPALRPEPAPPKPAPPPLKEFVPEAELSEYESAATGDFHALYDLEPFESERKKALGASTVEDLKQAWRLERDRVRKEIDSRGLESDPVSRHLFRLEQQLKKHSQLSRVKYTLVRDASPYAFFVHSSPQRDPGVVPGMLEKLLPWLREVEATFGASYAQPLGLKPSTASPCHTFAILPTRELYSDYLRMVKERGRAEGLAHYDSDLRLIVTWGSLEEPGSLDGKRWAILHELVNALQHRYCEGPGKLRPLWFVEGHAQYLTAGKLENLVDLSRRELDREHLKHFVDLVQKPAEGALHASLLRELVGVDGSGYGKVIEASRQRLGKPLKTEAEARSFDLASTRAFDAQSYLLMHFVHHGMDGKHRQAFLQYFREVVKGEHGWNVFLKAFGKDPEGEFLSYLKEAYEKHWPGVLGADALKIPRKPKAPPASAASKTRGDPRKASRPRDFDPKLLALSGEEWEAKLAAALELGRTSRLDEAGAALRALKSSLEVEKASKETASPRVIREIQRIEEVVKLRNAFLAGASEKQSVLEVGAARGRVAELDRERGIIRLKVGNSVKELPLVALTLENLRKCADAAGLLKGVGSWPGAYLLALQGQPAARVLDSPHLRDKQSTPARELRQDVQDGFERLVAQGEAALALDELSRGKPARGEERADALTVVERVKDVVARHGAEPVVQKRRELLRKYAEALLHGAFDSSDVECLGIHGALEQLDGGRIRLSYSFDLAEEADDFLPRNDYLDGMRRELVAQGGVGAIQAPAASGFRVQNGTLEGIGAACSRLSLPFAAPFRVSYSIEVGSGRARSGPEAFSWMLGVCDDGREHNIRCTNSGALLFRLDGRPEVVEGGLAMFEPGATYPYEVRHDGRIVELESEKNTVRSPPLPHLTGGSLFLWIHSNLPVRLKELTIEAKLDEGLLDEVRDRWIEAQLGGVF